MKKKIVVLGAGVSGVGAAVLAKKKGLKVFVSDKGSITDKNKAVLLNNEIDWEEGSHTLDLILNADEVINVGNETDPNYKVPVGENGEGIEPYPD